MYLPMVCHSLTEQALLGILLCFQLFFPALILSHDVHTETAVPLMVSTTLYTKTIILIN